MFLPFAVVVVLGATLLAGGRLSALGRLRVRSVWLLLVALALQILITEVVASRAPGWVDDTVHVGSYLLAAVFVWRNRRLPGLLLLGAGAALNGLVIALNGGELPASASALAAAGIHQRPGAFANSGRLAHPVLAWLGDVAATPAWLPFRNVFSVGDLLILAGAAWLIIGVCGTRWTTASAPSSPTAAWVAGSEAGPGLVTGSGPPPDTGWVGG
jgi:hypothetical protein